MAKKKTTKEVGETLVRIGVQGDLLAKYIFDEKVNGGQIGLKQIKEMSNIIVNNVRKLEELDKEVEEDA